MRARVAAVIAAVVVVGILGYRARIAHRRAEPAYVADAAAVTPPAPAVAEPQYVGVVLSERTVDVVARVDGQVGEVKVKLGDRVRAGQIIVKIEVPKLQSQVAAAKAATAGIAVARRRAEAEATEAERLVHYKETLNAERVGSKEEVESARYEAKAALLRVEEATAKLAEQRGRLQELERDLEATTVKAPVDGVVAIRYVDPGTSTTALRKLVRIVGDGQPLVRFAVPQGDLARIPIGSEVIGRGTASGVQVHARVIAVSPEVDPAANMLFVEAQVLEAGAWRSGELVHVACGG